MQRLKFKPVFLLFSILMPFLLNAQTKFYTVIDPTTIGKNQQLQVQYVIENAKSVDKFTAPSFPDFVLLQGPMQSSGMSVINGSTSQYKALIYVLQPKATGKLTIKGASAIVDGKQTTSNSVVVTVTNKVVQSQSPPPGFGLPMPDEAPSMERELYLKTGEDAIEKIKANLFVKAEVNKTSVYVNEPVVATYKLYSRLRSDSRVVKRPSYNGFSVYDMVDPDGAVNNIETLNGKSYNVHIIRQSQLFPLQAGTYTLEPVEVENVVSFIKSDADHPGNSGGFDDFFDMNAERVEHTLVLSSKPLTIEVKPLPTENQPPAFDGAVGNFKVEAFVEGDSIKSGEVATLNVRVKGKGNLPIINAPAIRWPEGIEAYDPETKEDIHPETVPLSGEKSFKFRFISKVTGPVVIPPIRFNYFDPIEKKYKTDSTGELKFNMVASKAPDTGKAKNIPVKILSSPGNNNLLLWIAGGVVLVMAALWILFSIQSQNRKKARQKAIEEQQLKMQKEASDPFLTAKDLLARNDKTAFLKEIENLIWKQVAEKLSISSTDLNQPRVMQELNTRNAGGVAYSFRTLVNDCATSLYTPGQSMENLEEIFVRAQQLIKELDKL